MITLKTLYLVAEIVDIQEFGDDRDYQISKIERGFIDKTKAENFKEQLETKLEDDDAITYKIIDSALLEE